MKILKCDFCDRETSEEKIEEFQEYVEINHSCGYGSIIEDEQVFHLNMCQYCFKKLLTIKSVFKDSSI